MRQVLIDADAFLIVRHLNLLDRIRALPHPPPPLVTTGYIRFYELRDVAAVVDGLIAAGCLVVEEVKTKTAAGKLNKQLKTRADKGEAEAIAWAVHSGRAKSLLFISNDTAPFTTLDRPPCARDQRVI